MKRSCLTALLAVLAVACSSPPSPPARIIAGGCAGTVATDSEPPAWAQSGWTHQNVTPWPVPWVLGTFGNAVAYLFATELVAGGGARVDGSSNKVLWVVKDSPTAAIAVVARPFGLADPVVVIKVAGGPSIVEVPSPGCWTFKLSWSASGDHSSTINLEVLPTGTLPSR